MTLWTMTEGGAPLEPFYDTARGYRVYRQKAGHGGYTYWIDDVGGGRVLFDEGLDDWEPLYELRKKLDGQIQAS